MTAALAPESINYVCTLVRQRSAIELDDAKAYWIEARLNPLAKRHGFATANEMVASLKSQPRHEVQQQLVEAMTTNETSFFRDVHPFDAVRQHIIPDLMKRSIVGRKINIWSAACS